MTTGTIESNLIWCKLRQIPQSASARADIFARFSLTSAFDFAYSRLITVKAGPAGGVFESGWSVEVMIRQTGNSIGTKDTVRAPCLDFH